MVDQRAVTEAMKALGRKSKTLREGMTAAIEAYEAAKWRPIEEYQELPFGTEIEVYAPKLKTKDRNRWYDTVSEGGEAFWSYNYNLPQYVGAMFRTIDPPKQDAAQGAGHARQQPIGDQSGAQ